jgi:hypothetical protein
MLEGIGAQLVAHAVGDYLLQSHWMATQKVRRWLPAVLHGLTYALPFLLITRSPLALIIISGTHMIIDRYRLARHVVWAKNLLGPRAYRADHTPTGYPAGTPDWLAVWLLIAADNTLHVCINAAAVAWC